MGRCATFSGPLVQIPRFALLANRFLSTYAALSSIGWDQDFSPEVLGTAEAILGNIEQDERTAVRNQILFNPHEVNLGLELS